jgi:AcrR family transcriptional regulator
MNVKKDREHSEKARDAFSGSARQPSQRRTQAERSEATRNALMAAARRLFTAKGYDGVSAEEIVREAGVTRGALYHHFGGKAELLEAVYERLEAESTERVARIVLGSELESPVEAMKAGIEAFLDECAEPELQRIGLHDAPAVLGWDRWREIAAANGLGLIEASLTAAIEAGEIRPLPVKPLAHLLLGALDEAAMLIARSDDPASRTEVTTVLAALLDSFAVGPNPTPE